MYLENFSDIFFSFLLSLTVLYIYVCFPTLIPFSNSGKWLPVIIDLSERGSSKPQVGEISESSLCLLNRIQPIWTKLMY